VRRLGHEILSNGMETILAPDLIKLAKIAVMVSTKVNVKFLILFLEIQNSIFLNNGFNLLVRILEQLYLGVLTDADEQVFQILISFDHYAFVWAKMHFC
jgi:short subunit fatty acids transporter